jgi:ABC-type tungstate transport system permease subunit
MYNDFVLIGQRSAPADTAGSDMVVALERIAGRRCGKWSCKIHKPT